MLEQLLSPLLGFKRQLLLLTLAALFDLLMLLQKLLDEVRGSGCVFADLILLVLEVVA